MKSLGKISLAFLIVCLFACIVSVSLYDSPVRRVLTPTNAAAPDAKVEGIVNGKVWVAGTPDRWFIYVGEKYWEVSKEEFTKTEIGSSFKR